MENKNNQLEPGRGHWINTHPNRQTKQYLNNYNRKLRQQQKDYKLSHPKPQKGLLKTIGWVIVVPITLLVLAIPTIIILPIVSIWPRSQHSNKKN
jgi:hypothetical protein